MTISLHTTRIIFPTLHHTANPPAPVPPLPRGEPPPLPVPLRLLPRGRVLLAKHLQLLRSLSLNHLHNGFVQ